MCKNLLAIKTKKLGFSFCNLGFNPEKNSFHTIAANLGNFNEIDALPSTLKRRYDKFESAKQLTDTFLKEKAVFHKSCMTSYNAQKLARKRKMITVNNENDSTECIEDESTAKVKKLSTRQSSSILTFCKSCFFCEDENDASNLHQCETLVVSRKVKEIADYLKDSKVIAKFSQGDLIATEAKYHAKCLLNYYYKYQKSTAAETKDESENQLVEGMFCPRLIKTRLHL